SRALAATLTAAPISRPVLPVGTAPATGATVSTPPSTSSTSAPTPNPTSGSRPVVTTPPPAAPSPPAAPVDYVPTLGTHPHHDDPFPVCPRTTESGGTYAAYNPAGPYLGAYQFLQTTWNSAANHAGRLELVGVPANHASQYDQDDM